MFGCTRKPDHSHGENAVTKVKEWILGEQVKESAARAEESVNTAFGSLVKSFDDVEVSWLVRGFMDVIVGGSSVKSEIGTYSFACVRAIIDGEERNLFFSNSEALLEKEIVSQIENSPGFKGTALPVRQPVNSYPCFEGWGEKTAGLSGDSFISICSETGRLVGYSPGLPVEARGTAESFGILTSRGCRAGYTKTNFRQIFHDQVLEAGMQPAGVPGDIIETAVQRNLVSGRISSPPQRLKNVWLGPQPVLVIIRAFLEGRAIEYNEHRMPGDITEGIFFEVEDLPLFPGLFGSQPIDHTGRPTRNQKLFSPGARLPLIRTFMYNNTCTQIPVRRCTNLSVKSKKSVPDPDLTGLVVTSVAEIGDRDEQSQWVRIWVENAWEYKNWRPLKRTGGFLLNVDAVKFLKTPLAFSKNTFHGRIGDSFSEDRIGTAPLIFTDSFVLS